MTKLIEGSNNSPELPKGWAWVRLAEIARLIRGVSYKKENASKTPRRGCLPVLRATNINGELNFADLVYVPAQRVTEEQLVRALDIVIAMSSGSKSLVGKAAQAKSDFEGGFGTFCGLVRPSYLICGNFVGYFFQSPTYRRAISALSSGVNINNLRRQHIESMPFPLAPLAEQKRIVAKIEELFTKLHAGVGALKKIKAQLKRYRQAVLKDAFEGKLTEKWRQAHKDELEPASKLLKRIKEERRQRFITKQKDYLKLVVKQDWAAVTASPHEVLKVFLIEMVIADADKTSGPLLDEIIEDFAAFANEYQSSESYASNYVKWLTSSILKLKSRSVESRVLKCQAAAWRTHIEEESAQRSGKRTITLTLGSGDGMRQMFGRWLEGEAIGKGGVKYIRRTYLEEPAEAAWKKEETKRLAAGRTLDVSNLPKLPEGWSWALGDSIFPFITSGSRGWAKYYSDIGAIFLRMGNLDHDSIKLDLRNIQRVNLPPAVEGKRTRVLPNDILISVTADVGMTAFVPDTLGEAYVNQHVALARAVPSVNRPCIAWYIASREGGQKQFLKMQRGATKTGLGLDDIRNLAVPIAPVLEQNEIVSEIERHFSIADQIEQTIEQGLKQSDRLRQSILKKAFEGKLVSQDPEDEPAEKLVERIAAERLANTRMNSRRRIR
ncbi:MAG: restriction endonuclease subunit S [Planctomycetota bacterium]|jgi:restriction endonuclease S subunit